MSPKTRQSTINFRIKKNVPPIVCSMDKSSKIGYSNKAPKEKTPNLPTIKTSDVEPISKKQPGVQVNKTDDVETSLNTPTRSKMSERNSVYTLTPASALSTLHIASPVENSTISSVRKALDLNTIELPCRETEIQELEEFLLNSLFQQKSGSLYISGLPGTGKTAALTKVIENKKVLNESHSVFINCTAVKSSGSIYFRIAEALKLKLKTKTEKAAVTAIEKGLIMRKGVRKQKMVLLILDEIDQLESKFQAVLYRIFEWPARPNSRVVLVGIANAVDLTDRMLPRLKSFHLKPRLLHFRPYTKDQIVTILRHRLLQTDDAHLFAPGALELVSAKVAGQSGDLRRALDLGRRVLEMSKPVFSCQKTGPQNDQLLTLIKAEAGTSGGAPTNGPRPPRKLQFLNKEHSVTSTEKLKNYCEEPIIGEKRMLRNTPRMSTEETEIENLTVNSEISVVKEITTPRKKSISPGKRRFSITFNNEDDDESRILRKSPRKYALGNVKETLEKENETASKNSPTNFLVCEPKLKKEPHVMSPSRQLFGTHFNSPTKIIGTQSNNLNTPAKNIGVLPNTPTKKSGPRKQLFPIITNETFDEIKDQVMTNRKKFVSEQTESLKQLKSPLKTIQQLESPRRSPRKRLITEHSECLDPLESSVKRIYAADNIRKSPRKTASIHASDVMAVVTQMSASARSLRAEESAFPLHQKLLVCTLMLILTKGKNKDVTVGKLHEVYSRVCMRRGISAVDQSGFIFLCRQVEMAGGVEVGRGPGRLAKVTLQWDETEVAYALQDSSLLAAIMSDTSVLAKK